jgi:glutamate synthase (NADPH/NADH) large chain
MKEIDELVSKSKFDSIGWRKVPVDESCLGKLALENVPSVYQIIIDGGSLSEDQIEIQTYALRRQISKHLDSVFG